MQKAFFAYFDFMYRHGWLSPEGRARDWVVATAPGWVLGLILVGLTVIAR